MISMVLVLCFIGTCYCEGFSERPQNFSIQLLYHTQQQTDGHLVLSPFGIWTLITAIAVGATGNSYNELSKLFVLPKREDSLIKSYQDLTKVVLDSSATGVSLSSKNFVFLDKRFRVFTEFKRSIQNDFDASVSVLDFTSRNAARIANTHIQKFNGKVSNVLIPDDFKGSKMILTNVISFKGLWALPFNRSDTSIEPFHNEKKLVTGSVNMMYQKGEFPFSNLPSLNAYVLELPYGNGKKYSMLFVLPYANIQINEVFKHFSTVTFKDIFSKLQEDVDNFGLEEIDVWIPRFRISTNVVLNKPLEDMGVRDIFDPNLARFEKITKSNIFVSAIVHSADIEVTEAGTTASASTSAAFSDRITTPSFHANRPFAYFIMEKSTNTVIFAGTYSKPSLF